MAKTKGLIEAINTRRVYLDGAMGSRLIERGCDTRCAERLNLTAPEAVSAVHAEYLAAGANAIYTNTFGANSAKYPDPEELRRVITAGVELAVKEAGKRGAFVLYDAGPTGELLEPFGSFSIEAAYERYAEQARIIRELPVDGVVIETLTDSRELKQAVLAFRDNTDLPILATMTFGENGRTFTGVSVPAFLNLAQGLGVCAAGVNCSLGAAGMVPLAEEMARYASCPLIVKPNAGLPVYRGGRTEYDTDAEAFSEAMRRVAEYATILGGCCGTTPEYLKRTVEKTKHTPFRLFSNYRPVPSSGTRCCEEGKALVVGERVNPTGKKLLKQAIADGDADYIRTLAQEQAADGADLLDVNAGVPGVNEAEVLPQLVKWVQAAANLPVMVDTTRPEAAVRALRAADGIPVLNSVNAGEESLKLLSAARDTGAFVVGLCLDEDGIPETPEGRLERARRIVEAAERAGVPRERVLIDPLTMAVSVDGKNPGVTLETLRLVKRVLGVKTVMGLSNVSFGLPERERVNAAFYRMALAAGLDYVIVNPRLRPESDALAEAALLGQDPECRAYIASAEGAKREGTARAALTLEECVVRGLRGEAKALVRETATHDNYMEVINNRIVPALNELGALYGAGKAFLPELIAGAEAAKAMLDDIRERFQTGGEERGPVMLLATVRGDVHDIGKNIVKAVLGNYGYRIRDLGKDVPVERVVEAVRAYRPAYVGLSALMTTTLDNMAETVRAVKAEDPSVTVLVGGAVVTPEFAESIGADIYGKDAQDTAEQLNRLNRRERK